MADHPLHWARHRFDPFGLACDILAGARVAIDIDPRTPNVGYFAQSEGPLVLTISYGPDADLDNWLTRMRAGGAADVSVMQDRQSITFCGTQATRVVLKVVPPVAAVGHRHVLPGMETVSGGYAEPFIQVIVSSWHRQTPLLVIFQKPLLGAEEYAGAEERYFASFQCQP
jgi:hypothetical protein